MAIKYCLVRILGNDQPPRHVTNQTAINVKFILQHEPKFPNCTKYFVLNRMWNGKKYNRIKKQIEDAGYTTLTIPFKKAEYIKLKTNEKRLLYLTNQNEARNFAIKAFIDDYDVVLPFDSGTCFRAAGWTSFSKGVESENLRPYYIVPMWRLLTFKDYTHGIPTTREKYTYKTKYSRGLTEPQICVATGFDRYFTEGMAYGEANKVDMLWMLGVRGPWDAWCRSLQKVARDRKSKYYGRIKSYGFVCRLPSGVEKGDTNSGMRGALRKKAKRRILEEVATYLKIPCKSSNSKVMF